MDKIVTGCNNTAKNSLNRYKNKNRKETLSTDFFFNQANRPFSSASTFSFSHAFRNAGTAENRSFNELHVYINNYFVQELQGEINSVTSITIKTVICSDYELSVSGSTRDLTTPLRGRSSMMLRLDYYCQKCS